MHTLELTEEELATLKDHLDSTREAGRAVLLSSMHAEIDGQDDPEEVVNLATNFRSLVDSFESMADKVANA